MEDTEAVRELWKIARLHDRGVICPAEMWNLVLRVVDGTDPGRVLGLATAECQSSLRAIYHERPDSLYHGLSHSLSSEIYNAELRRAVEAWCLASDAKPV